MDYSPVLKFLSAGRRLQSFLGSGDVGRIIICFSSVPPMFSVKGSFDFFNHFPLTAPGPVMHSSLTGLFLLPPSFLT